MKKVPSIHHIAIKTHDCEKLMSFYCSLFGLKPIREKRDRQGLLISVWLQFGSSILMLECLPQIKSRKKSVAIQAGWHLLAITINKSERQRWTQKLKKNKIALTATSPWSLYFNDPDGNPLALSHYPD